MSQTFGIFPVHREIPTIEDELREVKSEIRASFRRVVEAIDEAERREREGK